MTQYPSRWIEVAVNEIARLPGIGKKTALRLALHLLRQDKSITAELTNALTDLIEKTTYCKECGNIADGEKCDICKSHRRDRSLICVVEDMRDVMAIENTAQYNGLYHVLGGVISPLDGIGPEELGIESLIKRLKGPENEAKELIIALGSTLEGDTTTFYISKKVKALGVKVSTIARGVPVGGELEFTDEITLGRSILGRTDYHSE
ncbi:MAG: recombination mediator RecR [Cyclobacteriaceae bacterium]|nr:recombination mediator RecR [Cyclobacteriaceae bacterium]